MDLNSPYTIITFYKFLNISKQLPQIQTTLNAIAKNHSILGLVILAPEGVNATIACPNLDSILKLKSFLKNTFGEITYKESQSTIRPFKRFKIKIREEIVTLGEPSLIPTGSEPKLSPKEWLSALERKEKGQEDFYLIDVRNWYETEVGKFKGAIDPLTRTFSQFKDFINSLKFKDKTKPVLMYCTGGIRCEKAYLYLRKQGFKEVWQLEGGILNYFKECNDKYFQGECFVFDHRVALTPSLNPSPVFKLCPHCGDPAQTAIICKVCSKSAVICESCYLKLKHPLCSKNCANKINNNFAKLKKAS